MRQVGDCLNAGAGILSRSDTRLYLGVITKPQPQSVT
jgi:hypothetical protein